MKTTTIFILAGALIGAAIASFVVPPALSWYSEPGGLPEGTTIQALVQIPEVIRYSTDKLIRWQTIGAVLGAVAGLGLDMTLRVRRRGRQKLAENATPALDTPKQPEM
jgi:hypothetical protein